MPSRDAAARVVAVAAVVVGLAGLTGCGDEGAPAAATSAPAVAPARELPTAKDAAPGPAEVAALAGDGDEAAALAAAGSRPAWRGVLDRGRLLARRGEAGVLHGRLGRTADGERALVDEAIGGGALAVRLVLPEGVELPDGQRLVAWGAFEVDGRRWRWRASRVARLEPRPPEAEAAAATPVAAGLAIDEAVGPAPDGVLAPSELVAATAAGLRKRSREVALRFVVVGRPTRHGDGWPVADQAGGEPVALVLLPGEEPIYGGLDYLADEERWRLPRGVPLAAVAVVPQRLRRAVADAPPLFDLRDRPRRVIGAPPAAR